MIRPPRPRSALLVGVLIAQVLGACDAPAQDPPPRGIEAPLPSDLLASELNTIDVFRRTSGSVVFVTNAAIQRNRFSLNATEVPRGSGSGFLWSDEGHVVTNYHVVQGGDRFRVTFSNGTTQEAKLVGVAPRKDLAVLAIDPEGLDLEPLPLGDSESLVVGQKVLAIGNPFGLDGSLTTGVISALGREIKSVAGTVIEDVIQTDASINPGNSGGPLLDSRGRLIGINTAIYSTSGSSAGIGFAVPVQTVARLVPQLIRYGHVKWAGLGVTLVPDALVQRWGLRGVVVREVQRGSPAERAGLRSLRVDGRGSVEAFDLITAINDRPVASFADLVDALDDFDPGDVVTVHIERDGRATRVEVRLDEI